MSLVAMRQTIAFIEDFAAGRVSDEAAEDVRAILRRPIRIPSELVKPLTTIGEGPTPPPPPDPACRSRCSGNAQPLLAEQQHLKRAYEAIMSLPPDQFELRPMTIRTERDTARRATGRALLATKNQVVKDVAGADEHRAAAAPSFLAIPETADRAVWEAMFGRHLRRRKSTSPAHRLSHAIAAIKRRWQDVSRQLAPYQAPAPTKVFR